MAGKTNGYIVTHSKYGDSVSPNYDHDIDCTLTLINLASQEVNIEVEYMELEGYTNDDCDDRLVITGATPTLTAICSTTTEAPYPTYTANLDSNLMSFKSITNGFDENDGFRIKVAGE